MAEVFKLTVPPGAIADLSERLGRTRFPDQAPGSAWVRYRCRLDAGTKAVPGLFESMGFPAGSE
jgi:hypothetical protein